jgi:hypothetical protein
MWFVCGFEKEERVIKGRLKPGESQVTAVEKIEYIENSWFAPVGC